MFRIWGLTTGTGVAEKWLTGNFLRTNQRRFFMVEGNGGRGRELTDFGTCIGQAVVKVRLRAILGDYRLYLLRVVDLPDDGLPTSPMRGSRGIARSSRVIPAQNMWIARRVPAWGWKKLSVRGRDSEEQFRRTLFVATNTEALLRNELIPNHKF